MEVVMQKPPSTLIMSDMKPFKTFRWMLQPVQQQMLKKWLGIVGRMQYSGLCGVEAIQDGDDAVAGEETPGKASSSLAIAKPSAPPLKKQKKDDAADVRYPY